MPVWAACLGTVAQEIARGISTGLAVAAAATCPDCALQCAICPDCICGESGRACTHSSSISFGFVLSLNLWVLFVGTAFGGWLASRSRSTSRQGPQKAIGYQSRGTWVSDGSGR